MPAKPINATARETVLTLPPALEKCAVLTRRSSLFVSATSLRISPARLLTLWFSELATRWMRATESDKAGKSLLWRMRRSRKSSVALPPPPAALASSATGAGASQACSASRNAAALGQRRAGSRSIERRNVARRLSSTSDDKASGNFRSVLATTCIAR